MRSRQHQQACRSVDRSRCQQWTPHVAGICRCQPQRAVAAGKGTTRTKPRRNRAATKPGFTAGIGTSTRLTELDSIPSPWGHHLGRPGARWPSADIVLCWPRVERQAAQYPRQRKTCNPHVVAIWQWHGNLEQLIRGKRQPTHSTTTQLPGQGSQAVDASKMQFHSSARQYDFGETHRLSKFPSLSV